MLIRFRKQLQIILLLDFLNQEKIKNLSQYLSKTCENKFQKKYQYLKDVFMCQHYSFWYPGRTTSVHYNSCILRIRWVFLYAGSPEYRVELLVYIIIAVSSGSGGYSSMLEALNIEQNYQCFIIAVSSGSGGYSSILEALNIEQNHQCTL